MMIMDQNFAGEKAGAAGFTLIEVSLAILVIGLGLLSVFSLFPSGLRSAEEGAADTRTGLFAQGVLDGFHGNAAKITDLAYWNDAAFFEAAIVDGILTPSVPPGSTNGIAFPDGAGKINMRYKLTIDASNHWALLEACDGEQGPFDPSVFYTEFVYQGW